MLFIVFLLIALGGFVASRKARDVPAGRYGGLAVGALFTLLTISQVIAIVPAGHVGVIDVFGNVSDRTLAPGISVVNPFANVVNFSTKTQEIKETAEVPSKEGLTIGLEVSLLYRVEPDKADDIYRTVGEAYQDIIVVPLFRSVTRGVTAEYEAKALYTSKREVLADKIAEVLGRKIKQRGIVVEATPLRQVSLPDKLSSAIEDKLRSEQESERMDFVLDREKKEAERKRIEGQGIADFQDIVSKGIDQNLLRWKGIEATESLAESDNAKIVVIGSGSDGLPLILGN